MSRQDATDLGPPKGSFLEGNSPAISRKSRLVKYYEPFWSEGYYSLVQFGMSSQYLWIITLYISRFQKRPLNR